MPVVWVVVILIRLRRWTVMLALCPHASLIGLVARLSLDSLFFFFFVIVANCKLGGAGRRNNSRVMSTPDVLPFILIVVRPSAAR